LRKIDRKTTKNGSPAYLFPMEATGIKNLKISSDDATRFFIQTASHVGDLPDATHPLTQFEERLRPVPCSTEFYG
jgi:hypothetical protein